MNGYTKLHATILDSSVWSESLATRILWITILAMADRDGVVQASLGGLARRANITREECERGLEVFLGPDPDSRDGTAGERIEAIPGGWLVLNHANYREKQTREQAATAARVAKHRALKEDTVTERYVTLRNGVKRLSASASASESDAERESPEREPEPPSDFLRFWEAYGRRGSRKQSLAAWLKFRPTPEMVEQVVTAAARYRGSVSAPTYQRHAERWIRDEGWNDQIVPSKPSLQLTANGRAVIETSKQHTPNMPLGAASCQCQGCVDYRTRRAAQ
jgi:hypothetical protein